MIPHVMNVNQFNLILSLYMQPSKLAALATGERRCIDTTARLLAERVAVCRYVTKHHLTGVQ